MRGEEGNATDMQDEGQANAAMTKHLWERIRQEMHGEGGKSGCHET